MNHHCEEGESECHSFCSPFYVCGTCVGFTVANFSPFTFIIYLRTAQHNSVYLPVELAQMTFSIWQPPKLS